MKKIIILSVLFFLTVNLSAQSILDSLWTIWADKTQTDTTRALALEDYIYEGYFNSNPDSAILLANQLYDFNKAISYQEGKVNALELLGYLFFRTGDYPKAISHYQEGLTIAENINYQTAKGDILLKLGYIHHDNGDLVKAINYYERSLTIFESRKDIVGMGSVYNEFGSIYREKQNYTKSLDYYLKTMDIYEELKQENSKAVLFFNIGNLYFDQNDFSKALDNFKKALSLYGQEGDKQGISSGLAGIGDVYSQQGEVIKALGYLNRSLTLSKEIDDVIGIMHALMSISDIYTTQKYYPKAINNCKKVLILAQKLGDIGNQEAACDCLYHAYKAIGRKEDALAYLESKLTFKDSLATEASTKKLQQMEFAQQLLADSLVQVKKDTAIKIAHQGEVQQKDKIRNLIIGIGLFFLLLAGGFFNRWQYVKKSKAQLQQEKNRSENLLLNILPFEVAEELKEKGESAARDFELASILFTDFKGYTEKSENLSAQELVGEIDDCFKAFDHICEKYGIEKIKTIGDAYMAAGGLPVPTDNAVQNTVLAALEMQTFITKRVATKQAKNEISFEMRLGIHTGPVVAGIVGVKKFQYDVWGDTVNTASRMESNGTIGKVNISQQTYELIKDDVRFIFQSRGKIEVKGKGAINMWFVDGQYSH